MVVDCPHARHTHQGWTEEEVQEAIDACALRLQMPSSPPSSLTVEAALRLGDISPEEAAKLRAQDDALKAAAAREDAALQLALELEEQVQSLKEQLAQVQKEVPDADARPEA